MVCAWFIFNLCILRSFAILKFLKPFFEFIDIVQSMRMNRPQFHLPISLKLPQPEFPFFFISWRVGEFYNTHDS